MKRFLLLALSLCLVCGCSTSLVKRSQRSDTFSFGVIADVQYGDKDGGGARHYRESLGQLEKCVADLNQRHLAFTIHLGDIIDGNSTKEKTLSDLDAVLKVYRTLSMPQYYVAGNHCLTAGKEELQERLKLKSLYYDFTVPEARGWRFVVLDGNEGSRGELGAKQQEWLESTLTKARKHEEKVIVFSHFPRARRVSPQNPGAHLKLMKDSKCVVAYFAGHHHRGGYEQHEGIHHVTVKGMVEAPTENSYAVVEVSPTMLKETGFGKEPSREMPLP